MAKKIDVNKATVYGIAMVGEGEYNRQKNYREYRLWVRCIERATSESYKLRKPTYKDCTIDPSWLNFNTFCSDIKQLENYELWLDPKNNYQIDKDTIVPGNKVYSKENCKFISRLDNTLAGRGTYGMVYTACKDGETYEFTNRAQFEREHGLYVGCVTMYLKNGKSYDGWNFTIKGVE